MAELGNMPASVANVRIHLIAVVACFAAVVIGYDAGFIGGTVVLPGFEQEFLHDKDEAAVRRIRANVISLFHAGAFVGAYLVYPVGVFWGRKWGFQISGALITLGSAVQLAANARRGLAPLLVGRVVSGAGIGAVSNLAPMYVSEIAPAAIRGRLVGMYEVAWQLGGMVGFFINYGCDRYLGGRAQWLTPIAVQCIPSAMFLVGVWFIPESPRWLMLRDRPEEALATVCYLRQLGPDAEYVQDEMAAMEQDTASWKQAVRHEFWGPIRLIFTDRSLRKRLLMTSALFVFQNTSGVNAINYYSVAILKTLGIGSTSAGLLSTGVFGVIKGVCCFVWAFWVIDRFGRKLPIVLFSMLCIVSLYYLGFYVKIVDPEHASGGRSTWGPVSALLAFYIWTIGFAFSWSGLPWVYMSEVFDSKVRNVAQCFNASANWLCAFLLARFAQDLMASMGYVIFFVFASLLLHSTILYFAFYPETKGISITDVDLLFESGVPAWKAHRHVLGYSKLRTSDEQFDHSGMPKNTAVVSLSVEMANSGSSSNSI